MPVYRGACHCGAIRFEAEGTLEGLEACNCSLCRRTAFVHWYVSPDRFRQLSGEAELATYRFGTHTATHHFCRVCGVSPFRWPRSDPGRIALNARCLEGVDLAALPVSEFDGRHWEEAYRRTRGGGTGGAPS
jgi:hypothetical protein